MKKIDIKSVLIGALLSTAVIFSVAATKGSNVVWEYKIITNEPSELEKGINTSTGQGWEFVSVSGPNDNAWGTAVLKRKGR